MLKNDLCMDLNGFIYFVFMSKMMSNNLSKFWINFSWFVDLLEEFMVWRVVVESRVCEVVYR